jgi:hypothetical protein
MLLDSIHGIIDRRVLLNYRIDPAVVRRLLPQPFRPKLFGSHAVGGVCMIRFKQLRPRFTPAWLGLGSENAAHRFAVEWDQEGEPREGVFIPRRDTASWFNRTFGGKVFPGIFQGSRFETRDTDSTVAVRIVRSDGGTELDFAGRVDSRLPATSMFPTLDAASDFFLRGSTGYSATREDGHYHGMELHSLEWKITPLEIDMAQSRFFDDRDRFPRGSIDLDCALLMRGIDHEWHSRPDLYQSSVTSLSTRRS